MTAFPRTIRAWQALHPQTYERLAAVLIQPVAYATRAWPCIVEVGRGRTQDVRYRSNGRFRPTNAYWVFQFTTAGAGELRRARAIHSCGPGTGMLFRANDPAVTYGYPFCGRDPWEYIWVAFAGEAAAVLAQALVAEAGPVLRLDAAAGLLRPVEDVLAGGPLTRLQGMAGARCVFELLVGLHDEAVRGVEPASNRGLARLAESAMLAGAADPEIRVGTIARALRVSREHLSRVFREQRGMTAQKWLDRLRVERAAHLLGETRLSVKEVAAAAGFRAVGTLIAAVHRRHGVTPSRLRNRR